MINTDETIVVGGKEFGVVMGRVTQVSNRMFKLDLDV